MQEVPRRKALWLEVGALCGWILLPYLVPVLTRDSEAMATTFPGAWGHVAQFLGNLAGLCILGLILWISGDPAKSFGIRKPRLHPDLAIAVGLIALLIGTQYIPFRVRFGAASEFFREGYAPQGTATVALWALSAITSATFGELFYRGYLVTRLEELTKNVWIGVVVAAALEAVFYLFWNPLHALMNLGAGLALGIVFVKRRNLWPLIAAQLALRFAFQFLP